MKLKVLLLWRTADEVNNHGFFIERRETGSTAWRQHGFVPASIGSNSEHAYSWIDDAPSTSALQYRLRQIDTDGSVAYSPMIEVSAEGASSATSLSLPSPHPVAANHTATVRVSLSQAGQCRMLIIDVLGRVVYSSAGRELPGGESSMSLDTRGLQPGAYTLLLEGDGMRMSRSFVIAK